MNGSTLVVAIGNSWRSDDGAGLVLGARIRAMGIRHAHVIESAGDVGLLSLWRRDDDVVLLDAVASGAPPGTVVCRDARSAPLPAEWFRLSSHQLGVASAVELARALGRLPRTLVFVGIEGGRFEIGVGLSAMVTTALPRAAALVRAELRQITRRSRRARPPRPGGPARQTPAPARA